MLDVGFGETPAVLIDSEQFFNWKFNHNRQHQLLTTAINQHSANSYCHIAGSRHSNFSDIGLFSPHVSRIVRAIGKIDLNRFYRLLHYYNLQFLARFLPSPRLSSPTIKSKHSLLRAPSSVQTSVIQSTNGTDDSNA